MAPSNVLLSEQHLVEMLDRYFAGESTPDEAQIVQAHLARHAGAEAVLRQSFLTAAQSPGQEPDVQQLWQTWTSRLALSSPSSQGTSRRRKPLQVATRPHIGRRAALGMAALVGAFAVVVMVVFGAQFHRASRNRLVQRFQTESGQHATVRLADGSTATLAPVTTLTVNTDGVTVVGEAFFSVISHSEHPFVVRTRNALVHVLGTQFSVRQYPEESRSWVVVEDGRVNLQAVRGQMPRGATRGATSILSGRMLGMVTDSGVTVTSGAVGDYSGWTHGILVLRNVTLGDAVKDVSRAYGSDIRVADSALARQQVRMEVSVSELPLSRVLELIGMATDAHYMRDGRSYVFVPGRSATRPVGLDAQRHLNPQPEQQYGR